MAFSESMSFGENTLNMLDIPMSQSAHTPLNRSIKSGHDDSDIVEESPTNGSNYNLYSKSIKERLKDVSLHCRKRIKSVSKKKIAPTNKKLTYSIKTSEVLKDLSDCFANNFTEEYNENSGHNLNDCVIDDIQDSSLNDVDFGESFSIPAENSKLFQEQQITLMEKSRLNSVGNLDNFHKKTINDSQTIPSSQDMNWNDSSFFEDIHTEDVLELSKQPNEQHLFSQSYIFDCEFSILTDVEVKMKEQKSVVKSMLKEESQLLDCSLNVSKTICEISLKPDLNSSREEPLRANTTKMKPQLNLSKSVGTSKATNLDHWNLPAIVLNEYKKKGVDQMFEWQAECLSNTRVLLEGANLVYSAPTSAGKTLVSEILMIKNVLERRKKAIFILPFISVVREKIYYLQDLLTPAGINVDGFYGSYSPHNFEAIDIAICTIEKSNSIINKLLENDKLEDVGIIVIDEAHLVADPGRGYILELLLAKVLYMCHKRGYCIQIIAMSATLPNLDILSKWLNAEFYATTFRPVRLQEMIKIGDTIYDNTMKIIRKINDKSTTLPTDQDDVAQLCLETLINGQSVLVFCPSKDWCETLCKHIAGYFYAAAKSETILAEKVREMINFEQLNEVKTQLLNCTSGLDDALSLTISFACAFHHAGLTMEERDIIEGSFKSNALKVIVATSTLSSGVNLPARRVIVRTPMFGGRVINSLTYRQMIGRAGRKGKETLGESILICNNLTAKSGKELIATEMNPIKSSLGCNSNINFKRAILEIIASETASSNNDLKMFIECTLFYTEQKQNIAQDKNEVEQIESDPIADCIKFLLEYEFIAMQQNDLTGETFYVPTKLGTACLSSSMPPSDGFLLFSELQKSRQCFVLESDLHAIYLVTPFSVCHQMQNINWMHFLDIWEKLPASMRRVGDLVGVREAFLVKAMRGTAQLDIKSLQIHKRFYTALALQELVNEAPITQTAFKYNCSRGLLQGLQQMASTFAGIVTAFCNALNWTMLGLIVSQFKDRLYFGIHRDLLDLKRIPNLNAQRARALFEKGITSLPELANADVLNIERILSSAISFDLKQQRDNENEYDANKRTKLRNLFVTGKSGMTVKDAAKLFIDDARRYLENELGIENVNWSQKQEKDKETTNQTTKIESNLAEITIPLDKSTNLNGSHSSRTTRQSERLRNSLTNNSLSTTINEIAVHIVDICGNHKLFDAFKSHLSNTNELGFAITLQRMSLSHRAIGANLLENKESQTETFNFVFEDNLYIDGVAFSFDDNISYYLTLQECNVSLEQRVQMLVKLFNRKDLTIIALNAREQLKIVMKTIPSIKTIEASIRDPKIAHWIIHQEDDEPDINALINSYASDQLNVFNLVGKHRILKRIGMDVDNRISPNLRGVVESCLARTIFKGITRHLDASTCKTFEDIEMPIQIILLRMELKGFSINQSLLFDFSKMLNQQLKSIEDEVIKIVGRKVNLVSTKEVGKILGLNKTINSRASTKRNVLQKINTPLSNLIIKYRKFSAILSNNVMPLIAAIRNDRIYGTSYTFTSTGRITMFEPNIQNVANDFEIGSNVFSFRSCFQAPTKFKIVSADFCQLELRILTHLSQDPLLIKVMKTDRDVFKGIASKWNQIPESQVDEPMRNNTKQICYGIIYGIGAKSLANQLNCDMSDAVTLMEQFHATYPRLRCFTEKIIKSVQDNGYVETLMGRKRYISEIRSKHAATKGASERKAVNTAIQGTAADILKEAMIRMDANLEKNYLKSRCNLILHLHDELLYEVPEALAGKVAQILKQSMENCLELSIPLPVKVKIGSSWGELKEI